MGLTVEQLKTMKVGVLMGGLSVEREVSLRTGAACADALAQRGYRVARIDVGRDLVPRILEEQLEVAFIALHGRYGEDGTVQGLLESLFIPYTGSGVLASAAGMDKVFAKQVFLARNIRTPEYLDFADLEGLSRRRDSMPFSYPLVVKPSCEGSSVGVSIVQTKEQLIEAAAVARKLKGRILVEPFIKGREIQAAVLDGEALGAIEIVPASGFYDYAAKYQSGTTRYLFPAPIPEPHYRAVCEAALAAHCALGCSGATRSDLILDGRGEVWLLEINTLPGMTATSLLPKIAAGKGIDFGTLCERILMGASLKA